LKPKHPHLKTLISVGGWTKSGRFSDMASTVASRKVFAQSCKDFIKKYGFDGVDLDWEYPVSGGLEGNSRRPEDGANYVLLIKAIRAAIGSSKLITIAAGATKQMADNLKMKEMAQVLDFINIMSYDYHGSWDTVTGHHTGLRLNSEDPTAASQLSTDKSVQTFVASGCPASKLNIGMAYYGRGYLNVANVNNGLFQKFSGVPQG